MKSIYQRYRTYHWWYGLKFEAAGLLGRLLCNRKPPKGSRLLHLGCGYTYLDGFVNADFYYLRWLPFVGQSGRYDWLQDFRRRLRCPADHWEGVFTEHTLEHLHYGDCLRLFRELHRTMRPGAWLRICVPGLEETLALPRPAGTTLAEQVYDLTQNFGHVSVWDADLLLRVLGEAGFTTAHQASYLHGSDPRLLRDTASRAPGSLYVEAQK